MREKLLVRLSAIFIFSFFPAVQGFTQNPECILPIATNDLSLVTGGQQYDGAGHIGIDFKLYTDGVGIIAPCGGVVTEVMKKPNPKNNHSMWSINIKYSTDWNIFIVFEPDTPCPPDVERQQQQIFVSLNQVVTKGQILGKLVVRDPSICDPSVTDWYPHIHWSIYRNNLATTHVCPADYLTAEAKVALNNLYGSFGLLPVCLGYPPAPPSGLRIIN